MADAEDAIETTETGSIAASVRWEIRALVFSPDLTPDSKQEESVVSMKATRQVWTQPIAASARNTADVWLAVKENPETSVTGRSKEDRNKKRHRRNTMPFFVGAAGFEPATSRPPAERATKLRHTPKLKLLYQMAKKLQWFPPEIVFTILDRRKEKNCRKL